MVCDTRIREAKPEKKKSAADALKRLQAALGDGSVTAVIGANGAVAFKGWRERDIWSDVCAYRKLAASNSPELRRAIARAEAMAGRKLNPRAVASGTHSHDGGKTWHDGH